MSNLYEGTGEPWAGQDKLKEKSDFLKKVELFESAENFGADPPIGSKIIPWDWCAIQKNAWDTLWAVSLSKLMTKQISTCKMELETPGRDMKDWMGEMQLLLE